MRGRRASAPIEPEVRAPGAFMPDGSYNPDAELSARGPADRFVRAMVASRNGPLFSPDLAAESIVLAKQEQAFPNHARWTTLHVGAGPDVCLWPLVPTSTSAEEMVKRCGLGAGDLERAPRHWCGEAWVVGAQKACSSHGHARGLDPDHLHDLVARVGQPVPTP